MSNPLVHGWNGDFHNSMFKKRFPSAATPALSSLAPTVGGVTAAGGRGGQRRNTSFGSDTAASGHGTLNTH